MHAALNRVSDVGDDLRPRGQAWRAVMTIIAVAASVGSTSCSDSQNNDLGNELGRAQPTRSSGPPMPIDTLSGTHDWLNTTGLRAEDLRGKVVVVNFWTYSCINSLRALPYLRAWATKYRDLGLVVIGVHTPEFGFEKDLGNVRSATASQGVRYPVALDNDYRTWKEFRNQAWPAFYFIGADGHVRHQSFGEGSYARSERLLQHLLSEANGRVVARGIADVVGKGAQAAADERNLGSPETYIGYAQAARFASPGGARHDAAKLYRRPADLPLNLWSLDGVWTTGSEFATQTGRSGRIAYRFHARDLHLVMGPSVPGHPIHYTVRIDDAPPGADHGADSDTQGRGIVRDARMYQLIRQAGPIADHTFEIEFSDPGVRAYAFTFG
jgi:thiol-disulfide isomerase/thioredoxin